TLWVGYNVHFSETCDEDAPQLITHVETTRAGVNDERALSAIHDGLAEKKHLPDQHLVDAGYVDAANLLQSQHHYGVDLTSVPYVIIIGGRPIQILTSHTSPLIGKPKPSPVLTAGSVPAGPLHRMAKATLLSKSSARRAIVRSAPIGPGRAGAP